MTVCYLRCTVPLAVLRNSDNFTLSASIILVAYLNLQQIKKFKRHINKIMMYKQICCPKSTFALCSKVWVLTRRDSLSFIFINSLFSLWVIRFWHYSWRAAMMQVSCSLQIKQRLWPCPSPSLFSLLSALAVWNWTPSIPDCIMLSPSCPSPLLHFLAYCSPHEVLAWEASGCSNDNVSLNCPLKADTAHIRFHTIGPLGWWLISATLTV